MSQKQNLSDLFSYMQDRYLEWIDQLSPAEKERAGEVEDWSVKDEIFHNMEWANRRLGMAETIEGGKKWVDVEYDDYNEENRRIFEKYQGASWAEAKDLITTTYKSITDLTNRISEDVLLSIPEGQENPLWQSITGSFVLHPMSHYWGYLIKTDSLDRLVKIFGKDFADRLLELNDSEMWQAVPHYNLACIYALTGDTKKSIQELKKSLEYNPEFSEWAQEDPDLESIRSDLAFNALVDSAD